MQKTRRKFAINGDHTLVAASLLSFWNLLTLCSISFNSSWISWPCFCKSLCSLTFSLMAWNINSATIESWLSHLVIWLGAQFLALPGGYHKNWKQKATLENFSVSQYSVTLQGNNTLNFRLTSEQVEICCTSQRQANNFEVFFVFFVFFLCWEVY